MMLGRKMLRTILKYKAQFLSMVIMTALGAGIFLGFNMEWVCLEKNALDFLEKTRFADYRIVSERGFSEKDAEKIASLDGVDAAGRYLMVNADVAENGTMLGLCVTENPEVSLFLVVEGMPYDPESTDGLWLMDKYADANNLKIGDRLTLSYETFRVEGEIKGLIEAGEQMICVRDETQLMPDFKTYGYAYMSPAMLKKLVSDAVTSEVGMMGSLVTANVYSRIYPQINVRTSMSKSEFSPAAEKALGKTLLILSKDETISYAETMGEVNEGKTMGSILPVLFLAIAILTMVTTMHRIAAAEKTQIGTLKALGFKDRRILRHYTSYAAMIGIVGTVLGVVLGYAVARFMMNPDGMMGTYIVMNCWDLFVPWWCWAILALILVFLTVIGYFSTREMLKGTAADALKPYAPRAMRRMRIENSRLWNGMSFGAKWNLRDILRHKARSFMTLFGVMGCMILIVSALGMNDTAHAFLNVYYEEVTAYTSRIFMAESAENSDAIALAQKYDGDMCASMSVQLDEKTLGLEVYSVPHDLMRFLDKNNDIIALPDDGALICVRIADKFGLKVGDEFTVSPYGTSDNFTLRVAGINRSVSESISISETYAKTLISGTTALTESEMYRVNSVFTNVPKAEISGTGISSVQSKRDIVDSFDSFMEILNLSIIVLIVAAAVLGVVVLYNLGTMSYTERYREMATLKVVGFKDKQIGRLLISQNLWLTALGAILGLAAGVGVITWVMNALASEYEMKVVIGSVTVCASLLLTFGVSLVVGWIIARKNRDINMVAALKTEE